MTEFRQELNTFCQKKWRKHGVATMEVNDTGTPSAPCFEAICCINGNEYSKGSGSSKDAAKEAAAKAALALLTQPPTN